MALTSISGSQALGGAVWAQIQQQQVARAADQAEQKARALRAQASSAQASADRAQQNARSLKVQSEQAQGEANGARLNLATMRSVGELQTRFGDLRAQLSSALTSSHTAVTDSAASGQAKPIINTSGQTTGSLLSVTA